MAATAEHLWRTHIVAGRPEAQGQLATVFGQVARPHQSFIDEKDAVVVITLPEQHITGGVVAPAPERQDSLPRGLAQPCQEIGWDRGGGGLGGKQRGLLEVGRRSMPGLGCGNHRGAMLPGGAASQALLLARR
jgi:hypothetical protein